MTAHTLWPKKKSLTARLNLASPTPSILSVKSVISNLGCQDVVAGQEEPPRDSPRPQPQAFT